MRTLLFICLASFLASSSFAQQKPDKFNEVLYYVKRLYVDPVQEDKLIDSTVISYYNKLEIDSAIVAMLENLDPHSTFISKEDVDAANQSIQGSFVGIGIRYQLMKDTFTVLQTIPGGPSEKVGILPGDQLIIVDQDTIAGKGLKTTAIRERLMGDKGTKVKVFIRRRGVPEFIQFTIVRDKIPINSVDAAYMIDKNIGYIKLNSFSNTTTQEVEEALTLLKSKGMKDLILDLQNNGGGVLRAAHELVDQFLSGDKLIVYSEGRAQPRQNLRTERKNAFETGRLVVLTNEHSASASEIVSGAVQDWDRGLIVGRRTFGKGLVQRPINITDGSQIRLTIARYFTPTGRFIQKPYDDVMDYRKDLNNRYDHGEYYHKDSIHLDESLAVKTLIKGRKVYGGGGVMPDIFVPLDTSEVNNLYTQLIRKGAVYQYSTRYMNNNREQLLAKYPNPDVFIKEFKIDEEFITDFFKFAKEDHEIEYNNEQFEVSKKSLTRLMKAYMGQNLYDPSVFYKISNEGNEILQRGIRVLHSNEYKNAGLDNK